MTRSLLVVLALFAAAILPASALAVAPPKDRYIVVLKDSADSSDVARDHAREHGARVHNVYGAALEGYAATIPAGRLSALQRDRRVSYVEPDGVAYKSATQASATWGLDRIDQHALPLSGTYSYTQTGAGVTAYVIDTGIRISHSEFGGRASHGAEFVDDSTTADDCDGHGTHVAGTVGGSTYGVAKGVNLKAVRVLDCDGSGYWSWVIAGIDWVTAQHDTGESSVANMSLGGGASSSVDNAVAKSIDDGVTYAVAAGNSGKDACNYSPARTAAALTMGATNSSDTRASWSNWGNCVDWFAPGVSITSAYLTGGTATWSGTSMASPHTAGAAALYLETDPGASPATVRDALRTVLTSGVVSSSKTTNNHLLFVHDFGPVAPDTTPPAAPTALVATAGDAQVSLDWANNAESDLAGYNVYRSTSTGTGYAKLNSALVANSAYLDTTAANGTTYYYVVAAVDTSTNEGAVSNEASATPDAAVAPPASDISLSAAGHKVKGTKTVDLTWSGATSTDVDVFRNGVKVMTTANDGAHRETLGKGGGSYTYQVCEAGTSSCSNESTVAF